MSYRALISVTHAGISPIQQPVVTYHKTFLGDDFEYAERLIHSCVREARGDPENARQLMTAGLGVQHFTCDAERDEWISVWADQVWDVCFQEDDEGNYVNVVIAGKDASGEDIFMRKMQFARS